MSKKSKTKTSPGFVAGNPKPDTSVDLSGAVAKALADVESQSEKYERLPINVAIPNTVESKMTAISRLSEAVAELARALNSTNVQCTISNNVIRTDPSGTGIKVELAQ